MKWRFADRGCSGSSSDRVHCLDVVDNNNRDEGEINALNMKAAHAYASQHRGRWPAVVTDRVLRTAGLRDVKWELASEAGESRTSWFHRLGWYVYLAVVPFAIAGALLLRRRRGVLWIVLAPSVAVFVTSVVAYGTQRFRVPADPMLLVLASIPLARITTPAPMSGSHSDGAECNTPECVWRPVVRELRPVWLSDQWSPAGRSRRTLSAAAKIFHSRPGQDCGPWRPQTPTPRRSRTPSSR